MDRIRCASGCAYGKIGAIQPAVAQVTKKVEIHSTTGNDYVRDRPLTSVQSYDIMMLQLKNALSRGSARLLGFISQKPRSPTRSQQWGIDMICPPFSVPTGSVFVVVTAPKRAAQNTVESLLRFEAQVASCFRQKQKDIINTQHVTSLSCCLPHRGHIIGSLAGGDASVPRVVSLCSLARSGF